MILGNFINWLCPSHKNFKERFTISMAERVKDFSPNSGIISLSKSWISLRAIPPLFFSFSSWSKSASATTFEVKCWHCQSFRVSLYWCEHASHVKGVWCNLLYRKFHLGQYFINVITVEILIAAGDLEFKASWTMATWLCSFSSSVKISIFSGRIWNSNWWM